MTGSEGTVTKTSTHELPVYFIADSHLGAESAAKEEIKEAELQSFLGWLRGRSSQLYLVGDVFDFWFEYPYSTPRRYPGILEKLSALSGAGTRLDFLGGNHDYWAGAAFEAATGATVHRGPIDRMHFGKRLFIAHGDGLPRGDLGYRALKTVLRNRVAIGCFSFIPPRAGAAVARWASGLSIVTDERIDRAVPPMLEFMNGKLQQGYDAVVVGHIHRQIVRTTEHGTVVVIGDWMSSRSVVELGPDGFSPLTWRNGVLAEP